MARFAIAFVDSRDEDEYFVGQICFKSFREYFHASASYWEKADYEEQWSNALDHFRGGGDRTCFVVSTEDPRIANFFRTWVFYRLPGNQIALQERILFSSQLRDIFDLHRAWEFVPDRRTVTSDGQRISEWILDNDEVLDA